MSNKYSQNLLDSVKKSTTDAIETTSKRAIQKTADATGDLIGQKKKNATYITSISKSPKEFHWKESHSQKVSKDFHSKIDDN